MKMVSSGLSVSRFGEIEGKEVQLYTINFPGKLEASVTNYGGILVSLKVPDRTGKLEDIVLGYDNLEGYLKETPYYGAIIGRFANRIANGSFTLEGKKYRLAVNSGKNHIHGGIIGFDKVAWKVIDTIENKHRIQIVMEYVSHDGEEGYPGTLKTTVTYTFTKTEFQIDYRSTTDKTTIINLTHHSYFNLSGHFNNTILDHELSINANKFLPLNKTQIPTGKFERVESTPFDFRVAKAIGQDIEMENQQLKFGSGYDHCWVFDEDRDVKDIVASLCHPQSGRSMEVYTTEPGVQLYTGNFLDNSIPGKKGIFYHKRSALCLETQHFPDSPNHSSFPSVVLKPGKVFESNTVYRFSIK
ncbi:MAG: galactose mutarotase [Cyclobacteriaceae bacterium]|nr:galactose mutarotase [Cyclobacteriaceae bacterium]